jgi:hypothetical protein
VGTLAKKDSLVGGIEAILHTREGIAGIGMASDSADVDVDGMPEGSIDTSSASIDDGSTLSKIDGRFALAAAAAGCGRLSHWSQQVSG